LSKGKAKDKLLFLGLTLILAGLIAISILTHICLNDIRTGGWVEISFKVIVYTSLFILFTGIILVGALMVEASLRRG